MNTETFLESVGRVVGSVYCSKCLCKVCVCALEYQLSITRDRVQRSVILKAIIDTIDREKVSDFYDSDDDLHYEPDNEIDEVEPVRENIADADINVGADINVDADNVADDEGWTQVKY